MNHVQFEKDEQLIMPTIIIADDHQIVSEGIARLVEKNYQVQSITTNAEELIQAAKQFQPDIIITDISMPGMQLNQTLGLLKRTCKEAKIICLTMHDEAEILQAAFEYGADGYIVKHQAGFELLQALETVLAGKQYVSAELQEKFNQKTVLTARQLDILKLLAKGMSAKKIALSLNISAKTVEYHKYKMIEQLDLDNASSLVAYAHSRNLI
ncbi:two component transcriptional regulator, LuxR family [Shewanella pealeana ATCC 700345]|uniref:Two component transcriptional regulator, LuxR family n=2 Tax=Shewanella pealeana TaxID=70864 RepID=A8H3B9_SHEPA|nr:response regulator transcription factor [Shewanella pealeana]ABV87056.1 two component transcriptional regulator, LuxR family [Shewanella pealeana ATCC 700345]